MKQIAYPTAEWAATDEALDAERVTHDGYESDGDVDFARVTPSNLAAPSLAPATPPHRVGQEGVQSLSDLDPATTPLAPAPVLLATFVIHSSPESSAASNRSRPSRTGRQAHAGAGLPAVGEHVARGTATVE